MRRLATALLLLAGFAYLAVKAEYLGMDAPDALRALIISPGAAFLVAAVFVGFPEARRRAGGCLLVVGVVAALACVMERHASDGWTFYTPYSSMLGGSIHPSPSLVGFATIAIGVGAATTVRRSFWGGLLLGLALWSLACFSPSEQLRARRMEGAISGMPRYRYYYTVSGALPGPRSTLDWALPAILACGGILVIVQAHKRQKP